MDPTDRAASTHGVGLCRRRTLLANAWATAWPDDPRARGAAKTVAGWHLVVAGLYGPPCHARRGIRRAVLSIPLSFGGLLCVGAWVLTLVIIHWGGEVPDAQLAPAVLVGLVVLGNIVLSQLLVLTGMKLLLEGQFHREFPGMTPFTRQRMFMRAMSNVRAMTPELAASTAAGTPGAGWGADMIEPARWLYAGDAASRH